MVVGEAINQNINQARTEPKGTEMERVTDLEGKCGANLCKVQNLLKIFLFNSLADFQCISFLIGILCWNQSQV